MHIDARTKRILAGITREEWEALAIFSSEIARNSHNIFKDGKVQFKEITKDELEKNVTVLLEKIGALPHLSGYMFLRDTIIKVYDDETSGKCLEKGVYVYVAEKYDTSVSSVCNAINNLLKNLFRKQDCKELEKIYSYYPSLRDKYSNKQVILALVGYLKKCQ